MKNNPTKTSDIFQGRVALVTGGSRGIGRACAIRLVSQGARVAVNFQKDSKAAEETLQLIRKAGGEGIVINANVAVASEVNRMVVEVESKLGPIDLLVNNAGVFDSISYEKLTEEIWRRTLDINLTGTYLVTWRVKDGMLKRRFGRIVNISSIAAFQPRPMSIAYSVSKAGVIAFTKCTAEAWASENVRVNTVAPGLIDTEMSQVVDKSTIDKIISMSPIPRIGRPEEVAGTVTFLLSEESSFTTGQTLSVCGGRAMVQ